MEGEVLYAYLSCEMVGVIAFDIGADVCAEAVVLVRIEQLHGVQVQGVSIKADVIAGGYALRLIASLQEKRAVGVVHVDVEGVVFGTVFAVEMDAFVAVS